MSRAMIGKATGWCAVLAVILGGAAVPAVAQAVNEMEPNDPISSAQRLTIVVESGNPTGGATVNGVLGTLSGPPVADLDFYVFSGTEGDVVTVDIDGGMGGARSVDTILGIFGPGPTYPLLRSNDDVGFPVDSGSISGYDSMIQDFRLPASGDYLVGVSSYPRYFGNEGTTLFTTLSGYSNGDYTLLVTGVTSSLMLHMNIDIKPGKDTSYAPINPKARGKIPVALLGAKDFHVSDVNVDSLTFGHTGNENSLSKCHGREDINDDGFPDMVCHFENQRAEFSQTDEEAILKGRLDDGSAFEGRGLLKVVPAKAAY